MAYDYKNSPSNPDAVPLYNDNIFKFWNWLDNTWNCNDWQTWHKNMNRKYGIEFANDKFLTYWNDLATGSFAIDCRSFDTSFRDYMKSVGLFNSLYSGVGIISQPIGIGSDIITNAGEAISGAAKGTRKTINTLSFLLPLLLIIAVIFAIVYFSKKYKIAK